MKTKKFAILIVLFSTLFTSIGQIIFKLYSQTLSFSFAGLLNPLLIFGFLFYALGAVFLVFSLKYGELSILYPIYSLSYVWVSIASPMIFPSDEMNTLKWMGVLIIILGVALISKGGDV